MLFQEIYSSLKEIKRGQYAVSWMILKYDNQYAFITGHKCNVYNSVKRCNVWHRINYVCYNGSMVFWIYV